MSDVTRRQALRAGLGLAGVGLAGCLGLGGGGGDGDGGGPDLPAPALGADADAADVVVKAWEDFQCPHCATFSTQVLPRVRENLLGDRVRYEHHDFPIPMNRWSWTVAMAARSVQERVGQEAFWTFTERAFDRQAEMQRMSTVRNAAAAAGADADTVGDDVAVERHRPVVASDRETGAEAGVSGTPAVFVNGESVAGSYESIRAAIGRAQ